MSKAEAARANEQKQMSKTILAGSYDQESINIRT